MRSFRLFLTIAAVLFTSVVSASAQDDATSAAVPVVEHDFEDADQVDGSRKTPWLALLGGRTLHARQSLIRPRTSFTPELVTSVEDL